MNKRATYNQVSKEQEARIEHVRELFSCVYNFIDSNCKNSRETSLAITKLEEAQFWTIKGISREEQ